MSSGASCGKCPAEAAWAGQRQSLDILSFVLTRIDREKAKQLLIDIGARYGFEVEKNLRADLNTYVQIQRNKAMRGSK